MNIHHMNSPTDNKQGPNESQYILKISEILEIIFPDHKLKINYSKISRKS